MDLLATLLDAPGTYVGTLTDPGEPESAPSTARMEITALPGKAGVAIDYECFSVDGGRFHHEHTVLGRLPDGLVLTVAHSHGSTVLVLHEDGPGRFVDRDKTSPFPVEHLIEVPEPGRIVHHWKRGMPGEDIADRDIADVRRV